MLQKAKVSMVAAMVAMVLLFLGLQYLGSFKATVQTTQKYTLQMQTELRQAMEEQREALEAAREEDGRHLEAVVSEVEMKVALLLQTQAQTDNTVAQQLETVAQQLRAALSETDRVLTEAPASVDDSAVEGLAFSQQQLISTIDLLLANLQERQRERERETTEREAAKKEATLHPPDAPQRGKEPKNHCVLDDADEHTEVDLEDSLVVPGRSVLPRSSRVVEYYNDDVFSIPAEELFGGDQNKTMIYRLGFPSTSSSNLRKIIETTAKLTEEEDFSKRLANCPTPTLVGCGAAEGGSRTQEEAMNYFRKWAGRLYCPPDPGQHAGLRAKEKRIWNGVEDEEFNLDVVLRTTMLREPSQYAMRLFADKRNVDGKDTVRELKELLGINSISGTFLFFDMSFEERSQCSLNDVTMEQWVNLAYWRWNYFVRGMADDYYALWLRFASRNPETREEAWAWNEEGHESQLLAKAIENLHTFPFFGIYDRIELSMELLAFTFCVDYEALGFNFKAPTKAIVDSDQHLTRGAALVGEAVHQMMRDKNRLDFLFFEYAERVFDERVAAMRDAQERGYRCKLADNSCGLVC